MAMLSRLFGSKFNDEQLTSYARTAVIEDPLISEAAGVTIASENGRIKLAGTVHRESERSRIEKSLTIELADFFEIVKKMGEKLASAGQRTVAQTGSFHSGDPSSGQTSSAPAYQMPCAPGSFDKRSNKHTYASNALTSPNSTEVNFQPAAPAFAFTCAASLAPAMIEATAG